MVRALPVVILATLASGASAQVINGGFEQPNLGFRNVNAGQTYGNWTNAGPANIEFVSAEVNASLPGLELSAYEGRYWIDLCGTGAPSAIYQDLFDLTPGQAYRVSFAFSANVWGPNFLFSMDTIWNGSTAGNFQVVRGGNNGAFMNWTEQYVDVVAQPGANRLMFRALTATSARGPAIDAVSIAPIIPAPGAAALLGMGCLGAGLRRGRRLGASSPSKGE